MRGINDCLMALSAEEGQALYGLTGTIATAVMAAVVIAYLIRMRVKPMDAVKGLAIGYIVFLFNGYAQHFMVWYRVGFHPDRYFQTANIALAYTLLPLLVWLCAKVLRTSLGFAGDVAALTSLGYHMVGRSGCTFTGCCYGFPCDWGVYSAVTGGNQFPVCWAESLFVLGILVCLFWRIARKGYVPDSRNLPLFLLLYGVCRFFSEMTRESTREAWLFWRISDVHLHMVLMAAVGGFLLWRIGKTEVGEEAPLPTVSEQR